MPAMGVVFALAAIGNARNMKKEREKRNLKKLEQLGQLNGVEVEVNSQFEGY